MEISVIASGSSGNSALIQTHESKVLIDAGISHSQLKKRLSALGIGIEEMDGVFITHEHTDHTKAVKRLDVPVYANMETHAHLTLRKPVMMGKTIELNDLRITAHEVMHDAAHPVGFEIKGKKTASLFTDLGKVTPKVREAALRSDALVLESNHDIDMLLNGRYPYHLKQRILGEKGHLSNIDACTLIEESNAATVFLAHISKNNNSEEKIISALDKLVSKKLNAVLTYEETELISI